MAKRLIVSLVIAGALCQSGALVGAPPVPTATVAPETMTPSPNTATPAALLPLPSATQSGEPDGCLRPPEDVTRVDVNGRDLNARTFAMLQQAARLYGGEIDITGGAITQGSYSDDEPLSFGTHNGGGAVDLSVVRLPEWVILWDDLEPLIRALRVAGFAAWVRQPDELAPFSPIHIHAIAVGDPELSEAAEEQLTGEFGYFRGYNGLPQANGVPVADAHGGPVLCDWMLALGYSDLRIDAGD